MILKSLRSFGPGRTVLIFQINIVIYGIERFRKIDANTSNGQKFKFNLNLLNPISLVSVHLTKSSIETIGVYFHYHLLKMYTGLCIYTIIN